MEASHAAARSPGCKCGERRATSSKDLLLLLPAAMLGITPLTPNLSKTNGSPHPQASVGAVATLPSHLATPANEENQSRCRAAPGLAIHLRQPCPLLGAAAPQFCLGGLGDSLTLGPPSPSISRGNSAGCREAALQLKADPSLA